MPELPEVETLRRSLEPVLLGRRIERAELARADVLTRHDAPAHGPASAARALLAGGRVAALHRRGKHLAIETDDGRVLGVHLGMTGQLIARPAPEADAPPLDRHVHARWTLDDGTALAFRDPRRFGGLWSFASRRQLTELVWGRLGPDALEAQAEALCAAAKGSRRAIKAILLDQEVLAGVGNIYADEALHRAGIRPRRPGRRVTRAEYGVLADSVRTTLADAVALGGSTIRDYLNGHGEPGLAQARHQVYGRGRQPCLRCGATLRVCRLAQRSTTYCGNCQR